VSVLEPIDKQEFLARHPWARKPPKIVYEDERIVAVNKPPGWLSIPDRWNPAHPNIYHFLLKKYGKIYIVHRLDWQTSGVNVFAKDAETHRMLNIAFERRKVVKEYHAIVEGIPEKESDRIELPLSPLSSRKRNVYKVDRVEGKPAITEYVVAKKWIGYSFLKVFPITGRPHQIRVHMKAIGTPIVGDVTYGGHYLYLSRLKPTFKRKRSLDYEEKPIIERSALHAYKLTIPKDESGEETIELTAPYFKDMKVAIKYLDLYRPWVEEEID